MKYIYREERKVCISNGRTVPMANRDSHKISCSFDQLHAVLQFALSARQQPGQIGPLFLSPQTLIIDAEEQRGHLVAQALARAGYTPHVAATVLEAYTLILGGKLLPLALILQRDDASDHFFLQRLSRHMAQKYRLDVALIYLLAPPRPLLAAPVTEPLSPPRRRLTQRLTEQQSELEQHKSPKISLEGQSMGRYHILSRLGFDSSGDVYRAYDRLREYDVAFKALQTSAQAFEEAGEKGHVFQRERDMLESLHHPHILPVFNCGKSYISGAPFFYKTMSYCAEGSLAAWRYQHGGSRPFSPPDVAAIMTQLAGTLHYLHGQRVVYGNFKLSNILLTNQAAEMRHLAVTLVDFMIPQEETKLLESMHYLAPERWQGHSLPASDQYGLAALAYELLTGRPPFQGNSPQILQRMHLTSQPQPASAFNPAIDRALDSALSYALAKRPQDRFRSIDEFARVFERCCATHL